MTDLRKLLAHNMKERRRVLKISWNKWIKKEADSKDNNRTGQRKFSSGTPRILFRAAIGKLEKSKCLLTLFLAWNIVYYVGSRVYR
jgi:hypothetical protein